MGPEKSYFSWASKESLGKEREKVVARLTLKLVCKAFLLRTHLENQSNLSNIVNESLSNLEKANHFFPRSLIEAPK